MSNPGLKTINLGFVIDKAVRSGDFSKARETLDAAIRDALENGGREAATALIRSINDRVEARDVGPLLIEREDTLELHIVEAADNSQTSADQLIEVSGGRFFKDLMNPLQFSE